MNGLGVEGPGSHSSKGLIQGPDARIQSGLSKCRPFVLGSGLFTVRTEACPTGNCHRERHIKRAGGEGVLHLSGPFPP